MADVGRQIKHNIMKIVNKQEFYKLPEGTLYSEYEPCVLNGLNVKGMNMVGLDNKLIDFTLKSIIGNVYCDSSDDFVNILTDAEENKTSIKLDFDYYGRDGLYEDDALYAIYEEKDIDDFIKQLQVCKDVFKR
jgi:hypothetical protein